MATVGRGGVGVGVKAYCEALPRRTAGVRAKRRAGVGEPTRRGYVWWGGTDLGPTEWAYAAEVSGCQDAVVDAASFPPWMPTAADASPPHRGYGRQQGPRRSWSTPSSSVLTVFFIAVSALHRYGPRCCACRTWSPLFSFAAVFSKSHKQGQKQQTDSAQRDKTHPRIVWTETTQTKHESVQP